jgi:hypothetical protein
MNQDCKRETLFSLNFMVNTSKLLPAIITQPVTCLSREIYTSINPDRRHPPYPLQEPHGTDFLLRIRGLCLKFLIYFCFEGISVWCKCVGKYSSELTRWRVQTVPLSAVRWRDPDGENHGKDRKESLDP